MHNSSLLWALGHGMLPGDPLEDMESQDPSLTYLM